MSYPWSSLPWLCPESKATSGLPRACTHWHSPFSPIHPLQLLCKPSTPVNLLLETPHRDSSFSLALLISTPITPSTFFPACQSPTSRHLKTSSNRISSTKLLFRKHPSLGALPPPYPPNCHESGQLARYVGCPALWLLYFHVPPPATVGPWALPRPSPCFPSTSPAPLRGGCSEKFCGHHFSNHTVRIWSSLGLTVYGILLSLNHLISLAVQSLSSLSAWAVTALQFTLSLGLSNSLMSV